MVGERTVGVLARNPRLRAALVALVLLLSIFVVWHLVGPALHEGMDLLGLCVVVLAIAAAIGPAPGAAMVAAGPRSAGAVEPAPPRPPRRLGGRHPPDLGDVLRR